MALHPRDGDLGAHSMCLWALEALQNCLQEALLRVSPQQRQIGTSSPSLHPEPHYYCVSTIL